MLLNMAIHKRANVRNAMIVVCALLSTIAGVASAQTPADRYIELCDQAIAHSKAPYEELVRRCKDLEKARGMGASDTCWKTQGAGLFQRDRKNLALLERLLRRVLGPSSLEGFDSGTINLETLTPEANLGRLDGMKYTSKDGQSAVLITTNQLAVDWLGKFYERPTGEKRDLPGVLADEPGPFMTQAWAIQDQHFDIVDKLSINTPKAVTLAAAFVGELCAEDENYVPDTILVEVIKGDKVYLISQPVSDRLPTFSDCDRQWQELWDAGKYDAAAAAFNRCYAARVSSTSAYMAAVAQAQRLIDSLTY
jgi:hypothetical protein